MGPDNTLVFLCSVGFPSVKLPIKIWLRCGSIVHPPKGAYYKFAEPRTSSMVRISIHLSVLSSKTVSLLLSWYVISKADEGLFCHFLLLIAKKSHWHTSFNR